MIVLRRSRQQPRHEPEQKRQQGEPVEPRRATRHGDETLVRLLTGERLLVRPHRNLLVSYRLAATAGASVGVCPTTVYQPGATPGTGFLVGWRGRDRPAYSFLSCARFNSRLFHSTPCRRGPPVSSAGLLSRS